VVKNYTKPNKNDPEETSVVFKQPVIYGSAILSNVITIYGFQYSIGEIVKAAFINSKLSLEDWNSLGYFLRDQVIGAQLSMMRARLESREDMKWIVAVAIRVKDAALKKKINALCAETKDLESPMPKPMRDKPY